ncbi:hypothetical protein A2397_05225 [Candidatus Amesbacteria bacterium RIFOXYB1_FULL_44_23]|uniref:Uncharacterized protein n=1 Tax=Candidatus Amesbacteria bacterium RIFOXYB1_FULL_44_23 TaxID=1797263 RepID=A0A1F4ZTN8_9BACT|nr:MAG: hypothetical protein A2397_05225 [Candidatus Amesbacteria bacterium RIFOXYB1_FULL_44_23]
MDPYFQSLGCVLGRFDLQGTLLTNLPVILISVSVLILCNYLLVRDKSKKKSLMFTSLLLIGFAVLMIILNSLLGLRVFRTRYSPLTRGQLWFSVYEVHCPSESRD